MKYAIAIDGPAGAGKSTIAKLVAKELNFIYVDTGAMYRAIALYVIRNQIPPENIVAVEKALEAVEVSIIYEQGEQQVLLNGENVSGEIRQEQVGGMASRVAAIPAVRKKLLELQRNMAKNTDVVMDGRDIGTFVLPDAPVKIYLTASVDCRAKRRYQELLQKGESCDPKKIEEDIRMRDEQDMNREIAPLKKAEDAVVVDSSEMTIPEVVRAIRKAAAR